MPDTWIDAVSHIRYSGGSTASSSASAAAFMLAREFTCGPAQGAPSRESWIALKDAAYSALLSELSTDER